MGKGGGGEGVRDWYTCLCVCVYVYAREYVSTCMCACSGVSVCLCFYVCVYVCTSVCVRACLEIDIHYKWRHFDGISGIWHPLDNTINNLAGNCCLHVRTLYRLRLTSHLREKLKREGSNRVMEIWCAWTMYMYNSTMKQWIETHVSYTLRNNGSSLHPIQFSSVLFNFN